jgi:hypothetical protein
LRRFPNLACLKLAGYHKSKGDDVILKMDYENLQNFEKIYISKVFTKTNVPDKILCLPNVSYGGTGFFYADAPALPKEIEHCFPDYGLYDGYVSEQIKRGVKPSALKCFTDYSIGFLTRGCFRRCCFCVNKKYKSCVTHSPIDEFYDESRKKIMLLDDNIMAHPDWMMLFEGLRAIGKPFCFKQGIDIRLITPYFAQMISISKYDGDLLFAFDNIADAELIERKLTMFREYSNKSVKMYIFCGYDRDGVYDTDFWLADIESVFKRLAIIGKYQIKPYLMRYEKYQDSPFSGIYKNLATYCNVGGIFKVASFTEFCENQLAKSKNKDKPCAVWRYYTEFIQKYPHFEVRFFNRLFYKKMTTTEGS